MLLVFRSSWSVTPLWRDAVGLADAVVSGAGRLGALEVGAGDERVARRRLVVPSCRGRGARGVRAPPLVQQVVHEERRRAGEEGPVLGTLGGEQLPRVVM